VVTSYGQKHWWVLLVLRLHLSPPGAIRMEKQKIKQGSFNTYLQCPFVSVRCFLHALRNSNRRVSSSSKNCFLNFTCLIAIAFGSFHTNKAFESGRSCDMPAAPEMLSSTPVSMFRKVSHKSYVLLVSIFKFVSNKPLVFSSSVVPGTMMAHHKGYYSYSLM